MANYIFKTDTDPEYTASSDDKIMAATDNASFPIVLPASPSQGNWVEILDQSGTFDANPLTVDGNGKYILQPDGSIDTTFIDSNKGDLIVFIWKTGSQIGGGSWVYYRLKLIPQSILGNFGL